ncbi:c-type cytochrome [Hydrogenophaga sp. PAMC20947]|uniref:c-type cytochrome n=1 Tax=Hydrogenophaga sp. PAMC20947 TaxID=2565558 RepID=UPI00109DEA6A|nr:c-type cytochrome [Hydrogenophaga sp. PAMC20947]QCB45398.1 c-type cytochrome [Hydrogenophaga sp. PAMC20947]
MSVTRIAIGALSALLLVVSAACQPTEQQNSMPASASGLEGPVGNGARIYFTGASERGTTVTNTGSANMGGGMMSSFGQFLTCAACHGPEGRGSTHLMHMRVMTAPDIRYVALSTMPEMKDRQRPYDLDDFRTTVEQGRHPDGEEVDADMPRWKMSEADLSDLFAFLKALPE